MSRSSLIRKARRASLASEAIKPEGQNRHAMLLKAGEIVAAGPLRDTLTADNLTKTFEVELSLIEADGRWTARAL